MPTPRKADPIAPSVKFKFAVQVCRINMDTHDEHVGGILSYGSMTGKSYVHNKGKGRKFKSIRNTHAYFTKLVDKAGPNYHVVLVRLASGLIIRSNRGRNSRHSWRYAFKH